MSIRLVCLDMAGTTVSDDGVVEKAFTAAIGSMGISTTSPDYEPALTVVRETMGRSKIEVFQLIFGDESQAAAANRAFEEAYGDLVDSGAVSALPGAEETLVMLRKAGIRICLTTGFAPATRDALVDHLDWADLVDLTLAPADVERGRPFPDMILAAASRLYVPDLGEVAVVGDTPSDMASGAASGARLVIGVLTGRSAPQELRASGATDVVASVIDVLDLVAPDSR